MSFDASKVTGVFPKERLPGFTGSDVAGSIDNLTLTTTGVTAKEYGVVSVNSKGRVVGARALTGDDIPSFNWSKVVSRPSTLSGYGITNALLGTGGVLTGDLKINLTPTLNNHVINKESFDSLVDVIDSSTSVIVGEVIRKGSSSGLTGWLRCNGGVVDKTDYPVLYEVIGDLVLA